MIIDETVEILSALYGNGLHELTVARAVAGVFFTGVMFSDGSCGVAATPPPTPHHQAQRGKGACCSCVSGHSGGKKSFKGSSAYELLTNAPGDSLTEAFRVAAMNGLSSSLLKKGDYSIAYDSDVLDLIDLSNVKKVGMVGAFHPFMRILKTMEWIELSIVEIRKDAFGEDELRYYVPAEFAGKVLPHSDVAIITGSSISNGTIDELMQYIRDVPLVAVVGPTASFLPDAFFRRNVSIVSGTVVTDGEEAMDRISEGGTAMQLFNGCLRKINIFNPEKYPLNTKPSLRIAP